MDPSSQDIGQELAEARQKITQLEQDHARCVQSLKDARDEADERAADAKTAVDELQYFVYAASHDLQQPLRAIGTHAQLLQRLYPNDENAREFTQVIVDGATQMNRLITDLLTYSRAGNSFEPQLVDLNAPLQWALYNLAKAIGESQAKVKIGALPAVPGDEKQLASVFENLIGNAIKFHHAPPPSIHVTAESGDRAVVIAIQDDGPGIRQEYIERVFEPFKRLHSKDIPGSGLGLSICRKILRAHGGKIWIESDGQSGTTAKFTLPQA